MLPLDALTVPTLLLDEARARANIRRMAQKAAHARARLRPHFKTHQSAAVGAWFRDEGIRAITVSSLRMARYFAAVQTDAAAREDGEPGWDDITVAFPLNLRELPLADDLAARVRLGLLVESVAAIEALGAGLSAPVDIWLEVDTGYHRSGVDLTNGGPANGGPAHDEPGAHAFAALAALCAAAERHPHLRLRGLLTHSGHSYAPAAPAARAALHRATLALLERARAALHAAGFGPLELSVGDTPTAAAVDDLGPVDELRPGNFVFYDWMQHAFGVCREEEIAVAVACPVVAKYPARNEVVLYGGAVHLSKEFLRRADGTLEYGRIAPLAAEGWGPALPGVHLRSLSQEHGIVAATPAAYAEHLAPLALGDLVAVLPVHSCLTADLLKEYCTLDGRRLEMMR